MIFLWRRQAGNVCSKYYAFQMCQKDYEVDVEYKSWLQWTCSIFFPHHFLIKLKIWFVRHIFLNKGQGQALPWYFENTWWFHTQLYTYLYEFIRQTLQAFTYVYEIIRHSTVHSTSLYEIKRQAQALHK